MSSPTPHLAPAVELSTTIENLRAYLIEQAGNAFFAGVQAAAMMQSTAQTDERINALKVPLGALLRGYLPSADELADLPWRPFVEEMEAERAAILESLQRLSVAED